jgi:flavin-dependent dehydrogenase
MPIYTGSQAVVIGGGIAGLLAARVLTEHFEHVLLVERDHYPDDPVFRAGAPQGRHAHIMLLRGQQAIEELFPGITEKLLVQGALEYDFIQGVALRDPKGWLPRYESPFRGYTCSRLLIEWQIRQELLKNERVQFIEEQEVVGLLASDDAHSARGVRVRKRGATASVECEPEEILADLVVDASGRDSHAPQWLQELGYTAPEETEINAFLGYASRTYELDPARDWLGLIVLASPSQHLRGGLIWAVEGGRWMAVLAGSGRDYPPTDEDGFLAFAKSLVDPALYDVLKDAKPLTPIYGYRRTENRWRHFEQVSRRLEGFVVLGDANCAFNPVYGQGMTVAALGALMLRDSLRQQTHNLDGLALNFSRKLAGVTKLPWQMATSTDDAVLNAIGEGRKLTVTTKWLNSYLAGVTAIIPYSRRARRTFVQIQHMIKPPLALFHPALIWSVLTRKRA